MREFVLVLTAIALVAATAAGYGVTRGLSADDKHDDKQAARGKYLVQLAGCTDCHTPGYFFGRPDMARYLGGSDIGTEVPGLGVFVGRNLTPDKDTGLGNWTKDEIATAIQTGVRPDGRILAPIMPWRAYAALTKSDVAAIVEFLTSVPPVSNKVPGPFGPDENPKIFRKTILHPNDSIQHN